MASQVRHPSTNQELYLLDEFPGLQYHRRDPNLPFNRFELELVEPGSALNQEIHATYSGVDPSSTRLPTLSYIQITTLALLSSPTRTLSIYEIVQWARSHFPAIAFVQQQEHAQGKTAANDCVAALVNQVLEYCHLSEMIWDCDLVAMGENGGPQDHQNNNWPRGSNLSYYLPYGAEEDRFAPLFTMYHLYGWFGCALPSPSPDLQARQRTFLMDLPKTIKLRILSKFLTFPNSVSVSWNVSRQIPIATVFLPPAQRTCGWHLRSLFAPEILLSTLRVCKELEQLGRFTFYSTNTFLADTSTQPAHPGVLHTFLSRIGPKSRQLLRSVAFDINLAVYTDKMMKENISRLGESYCLQFITLDINASSLPFNALTTASSIPGLTDPANKFQSVLRLKGLKHVTIFGHLTAQAWVDTCLSNPYAARESELAAEHTEHMRLLAEEDSKRGGMAEDELSILNYKTKRRVQNMSEHQRYLDTRKRLEKEWQGPAGKLLKQRVKEGVPPILDEDLLIQRPGLEEGYQGPDLRLTSMATGHIKVYDLDHLWQDKYEMEMAERMQTIRHLMRTKGKNAGEVKTEVAPVKSRNGKAPAKRVAATTSSPPASSLPQKKLRVAPAPVQAGPSSIKHEPGWVDSNEVDKAVDEALGLEVEFQKNMTAEEAKKMALRTVLVKAMQKGRGML